VGCVECAPHKRTQQHTILTSAAGCVFESARAAEAPTTLMFLAGLYHLISSHTLVCVRFFAHAANSLRVDMCIATALKGRHARSVIGKNVLISLGRHTNAPRFGGDKEIAFVSPLKRQTAQLNSDF
jgi:hypothetical protein